MSAKTSDQYDLRITAPKESWRSCRRVIMWCIFLVVTVPFPVLWLVSSDNRVYWSGSVCSHHQMYANQCQVCHTEPFRTASRLFSFRQHEQRSVSDSVCQKCHAQTASDHITVSNTTHPDTRSCAQCHQEHRGQSVQLAQVGDGECLSCHRDLGRVGDRQHAVVEQIPSFASHPDFALKRASSFSPDDRAGGHQTFDVASLSADGWIDAANIRFPHTKHLKSEGVLLPLQPKNTALPGRVKLDCSDCHRLSDDGKYMRPIRYEGYDEDKNVGGHGIEKGRQEFSCARCHPLSFRAEINQSGPLPHESPQEVRAAIIARLIDVEQTADRAVSEPPPRLPNKLRLQLEPQGIESLFKSVQDGCRQCHVIESDKGAFDFSIAPTNIPDRWMPFAEFRHDCHAILECSECHQARSSDKKDDIIMPSIDVCRKCHGPTPRLTPPRHVRSDCVLCHRYHRHTPPFTGQRTIAEVVAGEQTTK